MKLVIDIDDGDYNRIQDIPDVFNSLTSRTYSAIRNSTPLPEGHGRLIDADVLGEKLHRYTEAPYQYALAVFNESPTIIEADGGDAE